MLVEFVLVDDMFGEQLEGHLCVFKFVERGAHVDILDINPHECVPFVLITLSHNSLEVVKSAVLVANSPG